MAYETATKTKSGNVRTPRGRLSYPNLFAPRKANDGAEPKYSVTILIPKKYDIQAMKEAAQEAVKGKFGEKIPKGLRSPFLDGDDHPTANEQTEGCWMIRCSSKNPVEIVDARTERVTDEREVYPGRWGSISVRPYAYDQNGNKGVAFGLQAVQLLEHDEPFAGTRVKAEDEFEAVGSDKDGMFD